MTKCGCGRSPTGMCKGWHGLSKEEYEAIHKELAARVLSTNKEKWNTIPRTYSEIDTLRNKFKHDQAKLKILEEINAYIEEMEKIYQKAS